MSFAGMVCWRPEHTSQVVVADVVAQSDAVFLATHTPFPLYRRELGSHGAPPTLCQEEDLLRDLVRPDADMLILPIVGQSGRGKSHLIRWLKARIPETPQRRVVYIPKYRTSLRGVIEEILAGAKGETARALRARLREAAESVDETTAPDRLLDNLAIGIQYHTAEEQRTVNGLPEPIAGPALNFRRDAIHFLPDLLREPVFRAHLLRQEGFIRRFVGEALRERSRADRDEPPAFSDADLPADVAGFRKANVTVQEFYRRLVNTDLRAACVEILNENLMSALRQVIGLKSGDLQQLMFELRRNLLAESRELVLLIEDFTILQGIQRELLDAMIEAPVRDGVQHLCTIRVALATTFRYFEQIDTVLTRAKFRGHIYSVDAPHSDNDRLRAEVMQFIGAYLNAARIGPAAINGAHSGAAVTGREGQRWVPNACTPCPVRTICHDAFGRAPNGYGLYPFNEVALERMIRARCGDALDPREILGQILQHTLAPSVADDISAGRFPSKSYAEKFVTDRVKPVPTTLRADLAPRDRKDLERRHELLVYWGGAPGAATNLASGIHEAFRIPPLADVTVVPAGAPPPRGEAPTPAPVVIDQPLPEVEQIDGWKDGKSLLLQRLSNELRGLVAEAVSARLDWNAFCCPSLLESNDDFGAKDVRIEKTMGQAAARPVVLTLGCTHANARALQALVLFRLHRSWSFPGGGSYLRDLGLALDRWSHEVRRSFEAAQAAEVEPLTSLVVYGARVLGVPGSGSERFTDLLSAALAASPASGSGRPAQGPWTTLQAQVMASPRKNDPSREYLQRRLLALCARSQGMGGRPQAFDATLVLGAIRDLKRTWRPPDSPAAPGWLQGYATRVVPPLDEAIAAERERLATWRRRIEEALAPDLTLKEAVQQAVSAVRHADEAAASAAVRRPSSSESRQALADLCTALGKPTTGFGLITDLWSFLDEAEPSLGRTIAQFAADRSSQAVPLDDFLRLADEFLTLTETHVQAQAKGMSAVTAGLAEAEQVLEGQFKALVSVLAEAEETAR